MPIPGLGDVLPSSLLPGGTGSCAILGPLVPNPGSFQGTERFEVQRRIGEGGMGVVYQVFDRERKSLVALKTLRQGDPAAIFRFKSEFRSLADINHPNLITLHELVALDDQWFFTMELIEGVDFLGFVRDDQADSLADTAKIMSNSLIADSSGPKQPAIAPRDFDRLRRALRQLAEGVSALHEAGKLHRDIKPSNVLVTSSGRVVLLDFGLVADIDQLDSNNTNRLLIGTAVYMSPEQAASQRLSTASDWYSVGVILYEALTGLAPFDGPPLSVVMRKQKEIPTRPRELLPSVPEDLDELCMGLLKIEPARRPTGLAILKGLGSPAAAGRQTRSTTRSRAEVFIGRHKQLDVLESAFADISSGKQITVFIHGRSGMGKTALLDQFVSNIAGRRAVVLAGRCYECEYVPYKALDSMIDSLIQFLSRLPAEELQALMPGGGKAIARLFPVFRRVGGLADWPRRRDVSDPQELRRRGMTELREVLGRMAERQPLVLSIDNLQWSDLDSVSLLIDLIRPPESPPLLLIVGYRSEEATGSSAIRLFLRSLRTAGMNRREVVVGALTSAETRSLVQSKLGGSSREMVAEAESLVVESHGNPFFVDELVRYLQSGAPRAGQAPVSLEEAILARVEQLPDGPRSVLELVAVAGRPIEQAIVAAAADMGVELATAVAMLRAGYLIRTRGTRDSDRVETYHDRIRETVVANLDPARAKTIHAKLARALAASGGATPESLVYHFHEAGDDGRAGDHATSAAAKAAEALAFEHAAELYQLAIQCLPEDVVEQRRLRVALGDALANAGLGAQAAAEYQLAAESASAAEALELRRRAAEQRLRAGYVDEGLDALRVVLAAVGINMASSQARTRASLLSRRAQLRVRGYHFRERDTSQLSLEELTRIDVCWSAATGLSMIDTVHGADFQARHLLLALRAGEPYRVARALALEVIYSANTGLAASKRIQHVMELVGELVGRIDVPHAHALTAMAGAWAKYHSGRYHSARVGLESSSAILREQCTGVAFEIAAVDRLIADTLFHLGDVSALREHVRGNLREAERRGDRYSATAMRTGLPNVIWLVDDQPGRASDEAALGMESWSRRGFHLQHYHHAAARARIALYRCDAAAARAELLSIWPELERNMVLRIQALRCEAMFLRGRTALMLAQAALRRSGRPSRDLDDAMTMARKLAKERLPMAIAASLVVQAGIAEVSGSRAQSRGHLTRAARAYDDADMALMAAACWRRLEPKSAAQEATQWMLDQGIRDPGRFTAFLLGTDASGEGG